MSDPATQALIVSHNGNIILEQYGNGYSKTDFVTSQSIAKAFYAVLFGVAIEKGLLDDLDQPISDYLPEWKNDKRGEITIRNLLEMKSGLYRSESWNEEMFLSRNNLDFALSVELVKEPGEIFEYNNVNTALLGPVIEKIYNASPHEVLKKEILIMNFNSPKYQVYALITISVIISLALNVIRSNPISMIAQDLKKIENIHPYYRTIL